MAEKIRWGIIGTGRIAGIFAKSLEESERGKLIAVASRSKEKASKFADEYGIPLHFGNHQDLLNNENVNAVYIATPHSFHSEIAMRAAKSGKDILCEKPFTINYSQAKTAIDVIRKSKVFFMEAFMYRTHPQTKKILDLIREKKIGDVRVIDAKFSFNAGNNPESRLFNSTLGGGGILDVGCYCTSMARLIAGVAIGKDFVEPIEIKGVAHIGEETLVDEYAIALLKFPKKIIARISTGITVNQDNDLKIYGSKGKIVVPKPWHPEKKSSIFVHYDDGGDEEIIVKCDKNIYAIEADYMAENINNLRAKPPAMTPEDTLGNMKTLDMWRKSIGLVLDSDIY